MLDTLADLFVTQGVPAPIRSDNGPEFTAELVRLWLAALQVQTLFIEPGNPWENGYVESFNGKLRDELLDREIFYTLTEAKILIERWRREYNKVRPHSALGYRPPAPEVVMPATVDGLHLRLRSLLTTGTVAGGRSDRSDTLTAGKMWAGAIGSTHEAGSALWGARMMATNPVTACLLEYRK